MDSSGPEPLYRCPKCRSAQTERVGLPRFQTRTIKDPDSDRFRIVFLGVLYNRRCQCGCAFTESVAA